MSKKRKSEEVAAKKIAKVQQGVVEKGKVEGALQIGAIIFEEIYQGDRELAASKKGNKRASLSLVSELLEHEGMTLCSTQLNDYLRISLEPKRVLNNANYKKLGVTKRIALLRIDDEDEKLAMAKAAAQQRWTVATLKQEIKATKDDGEEHEATPGDPAVQEIEELFITLTKGLRRLGKIYTKKMVYDGDDKKLQRLVKYLKAVCNVHNAVAADNQETE